MKPGPATSTDAIKSSAAQFCRDLFGEIARFCLRILGQNHRGVGRHIAMRSVARGSTTTRDRSMPADHRPPPQARRKRQWTRAKQVGEKDAARERV